jgi:hypothetical protein
MSMPSDAPSPSPYPTSGDAVPNTWQCVPDYTTAPDGTYQQLDQNCAVVGWQATTGQVTVQAASEDINYSAGVVVFLLAATVVLLMTLVVRAAR